MKSHKSFYSTVERVVEAKNYEMHRDRVKNVKSLVSSSNSQPVHP